MFILSAFLVSCHTTVERTVSLNYDTGTLAPFNSDKVYINTDRISDSQTYTFWDATVTLKMMKSAVKSYIPKFLNPGVEVVDSKEEASLIIAPIIKCKNASTGFNLACRSQIYASNINNIKVCESSSEWIWKKRAMAHSREFLADHFQEAIASSLEEAIGQCSTAEIKIKVEDSKPENDSPKGVFEKAKKCQEKGGVWIESSCQISLD